MEISSNLLPPLTIGRTTRVVFGAAVIFFALVAGILQVSVLGFLALMALGLSFLIGGLLAIPGCELSALPNLMLPKRFRFTFP
jgi:hypothetical protein